VRAALESSQVGLHDLLVALDREQQRHVDVDAVGGEFLDRGDAGLGGRDLDHHVRKIQPPPELARLGDCPLRVVGQVWRALEGDEAVVTAGRVGGRAQHSGRAADVFQRDLEEELLGVCGA
jgi:hypothetical protein